MSERRIPKNLVAWLLAVIGLSVSIVLVGLLVLFLPVFLETGPPQRNAGILETSRLVGDQWTPYRGGIRAGAHVLILTHGIMENIFSAFPPSRARALALQHGYDEVLGVSYDSSSRATQITPAYAAFLQTLPAASIDIEAHSYGGVQTLSALQRTKIVPRNIILLGVPLEGTDFARNTLGLKILMFLPDDFWHGFVGKFRQLRRNGGEDDLLPGSLVLAGLDQYVHAFINHHKKTRLILIAGNDRNGNR